jgi:hypothetical protein
MVGPGPALTTKDAAAACDRCLVRDLWVHLQRERPLRACLLAMGSTMPPFFFRSFMGIAFIPAFRPCPVEAARVMTLPAISNRLGGRE